MEDGQNLLSKAEAETKSLIQSDFLAQKGRSIRIERCVGATPASRKRWGACRRTTQRVCRRVDGGQLDDSQKAELQKRLSELAETQRRGNPAAAEALAEAAAKLEAGDTAGAAEAMQKAAEAQAEAEASVADQQAATEAAQALQETANETQQAAESFGRGRFWRSWR